MFTGLVEAIGEIKAIGGGKDIKEIEILAPTIAPPRSSGGIRMCCRSLLDGYLLW